MNDKDVIISILSCGGKISCKREALKFKNPPIVVNVTGGGLDGFKKTASHFYSNGSIISNLLSDIPYKRICMISYLDGWEFISEVLKTSDIDKISAIIIIEGLNTKKLDHWKNFACRSANGGPIFWMAHSQKRHKTCPSKLSNKLLLSETPGELINIDKSISDVTLNKPVSIYSKIEVPRTKIYQKDSLVNFERKGNLMRLEYGGNKTQDQSYIVQYVQPRLWSLLDKEWNLSAP
jgi:hypothetical protein